MTTHGGNMASSHHDPRLLLASFLLLLLTISAPLPASSFQVSNRRLPAAAKGAAVDSAPWRRRTTSSTEVRRTLHRSPLHVLAATENDGGGENGKTMGSDVDEYRNAPTAFLANFMQSSDSADRVDPLADVDFGASKSPKLPLDVLASVLDAELYSKEWFVTGKVNPVYFDDKFQFQDPDVKLTGVEEYARGVLKLFDQDTSRAEIISSVVNGTVPNTITITWRLSGRVNIGPSGLPIKPYICYTDFTIDEDTGLISFQEDRFEIPGWDILLSALFPFLIGKVTTEPAPEVEPRVVEMPTLSGAGGRGRKAKEGGIFGGLFQQLGL